MEGKTQETAAAKAGMSVRSARKWQSGPLPSQAKPEHRWRTRPDPFDGVWEDEIEPLLRNDPAGKLKATTIIDWLRSVNAVLHWTQWRCCTQSGKPSRRWRRSCPLNSGPRRGARAWNAFWPGCPTGGVRSISKSQENCGRERRTPGERGRIPSKVSGATCWAGCRKIRTPARWHCWAGCRRLNRIVSAGGTCVRCSGGCSSGEASWPTSWSTPRPEQRCRIPVEYRKWRW